MGELVKVRVVRYADERWRRTFANVDPSQGEKERLAATIRKLRHVDLPVVGDAEVCMPPIGDMTNFRHAIDGTAMRLLYNYKDAPQESVLYLISLHRFGGYGPRAA